MRSSERRDISPRSANVKGFFPSLYAPLCRYPSRGVIETEKHIKKKRLAPCTDPTSFMEINNLSVFEQFLPGFTRAGIFLYPAWLLLFFQRFPDNQ